MAETPRTSWIATLGWAFYLACSWTWCIGMFLPVLLIRDYGVWGFVVFAVPNVVGAAAMGWVLADGRSSRILTLRNAGAVRAFTFVTWAFHVSFLTWLLRSASVPMLCAVGAVLAGFVVYEAWWTRGRLSRILAGSAITWVVSFLLLAVLWRTPQAPPTPVGLSSDIAFVAVVCAFGFGLCPYLDGTFHLARRSLGTMSRAGFAIGFGGLFLAMILGTAGYASLFRLETDPLRLVEPTSVAAALWIAHIGLQSAFTIRVHGATLPPRFHTASASTRLGFGGGLAIMALGAASAATEGMQYHGLSIGEVLYRLFMAFYGLAFPAYVWLCLIPTRDGHSGLGGAVGRRKLVVWGFAVVLAAPAFWMGFIERVEWWLAPGLGVVLLARLLIPGGAGFGRLRPLARKRQDEED